MPNFQAKNISRKQKQSQHKFCFTLFKEQHGWVYTPTSDFLNTHKNPYFNQATPKNTCQHFLTQKNPDIENFKPKNILWSSLSLEIPSTPQPWNSEIIQLKWWQKAQKWDDSETAKRKSTNTIHRKGTWLPSQHEFGLTWWPCAGFEPGQESTHEEI